jgi:hypothetical protein
MEFPFYSFLAEVGILDDQTFGALLEAKPIGHTRRFVAVVDARGDKRPRRLFSRWQDCASDHTL